MLIVALALLSAQTGGKLAARAQPIDRAGWISSEDYPSEALIREEQGTVTFVVEVDAEGRPGDCVTSDDSGSDALEAATCSLIRERARFKPARDAKGRAVPSRYTSRIAWKLPDGPAKFAAGMTITKVELAPSGAILGCTTETEGDELALMMAYKCEWLQDGRLPGLGAEEQPAPRFVRLVTSLSLAGQPFAIDKSSEWGSRVARTGATFEIDADGSIKNCHPIGPSGESSPHCDFFEKFPLRYALPPGSTARSGSLEMSVFVERHQAAANPVEQP